MTPHIEPDVMVLLNRHDIYRSTIYRIDRGHYMDVQGQDVMIKNSEIPEFDYINSESKLFGLENDRTTESRIPFESSRVVGTGTFYRSRKCSQVNVLESRRLAPKTVVKI
jgi:hypothetical protein